MRAVDLEAVSAIARGNEWSMTGNKCGAIKPNGCNAVTIGYVE
jgi:hypothetical protein